MILTVYGVLLILAAITAVAGIVISIVRVYKCIVRISRIVWKNILAFAVYVQLNYQRLLLAAGYIWVLIKSGDSKAPWILKEHRDYLIRLFGGKVRDDRVQNISFISTLAKGGYDSKPDIVLNPGLLIEPAIVSIILLGIINHQNILLIIAIPAHMLFTEGIYITDLRSVKVSSQ